MNKFLSFFWRYISFFRYFFIVLICNCFCIILLQISFKFCNSVSYFSITHIYFFFFIPSLYYYFHLRPSMVFYFSSADIYLSLGCSLSFSFVTVSELFCCEFCETFNNFISNFITNQTSYRFCCFWNYSF